VWGSYLLLVSNCVACYGNIIGPCRGSSGYSAACLRGGPNSIPRLFVGICSGQSATVTVFPSSTSVFAYHYHSTIAPHSFIHLPPTLYNVFLPILQFFPVSIIPTLLHTHPSICHPHCIMFLSQYFSFPLSVSFHHRSILIHPSTTHAV